MLVIGIVIGLLLLLILIVIWLPLRVIIDTPNDVFKVEWRYIASAFLTEMDSRLGFYLTIPFYKKFIPIDYFFKIITDKNKAIKKVPAKEKTSNAKKTPSVKWRLIKKIIRTFDIKTCKVNWDTDDYILNAYLYPLTPFLTRGEKFFHINFEGKRDIVLVVENRIIRILKSFF